MSAKRTSNRRQFLKGQTALDALADAAERIDPESSSSSTVSPWPGPPPAEAYLLQFGRQAMACQFEVFLNAGQYREANEAVVEALDLVDRLEAQLTVYRDTSEIMAINRQAAEGPVTVEPRLFRLLELAVELHRQTQGAFDITSGPLTKVWGFFRRQGALPEEADLAAALARVGSQFLELDATASSVRFLRPGVELNLGAIGKGYALDRAAESMLDAGIGDFLWHGGQSSILARGSQATQAADEPGWQVGVRHPMRPEKQVIEIRLCDRALGASGAGTQFFRHRGRRYGHIIDPRSGWPAEGVISTTVLAPTAAEADALATAFYILGPERAVAWCEGRPEIGMLMFVPGPTGQSVQLIAAGVTDRDWRLTGPL
ncbi:MAG TPA: FAD:protein FMN transferase [Pirellulales bacterium]|nr:FAD:protein FMN transferase [Pirellulales bacterium]